jgi:hypothetical protein
MHKGCGQGKAHLVKGDSAADFVVAVFLLHCIHVTLVVRPVIGLEVAKWSSVPSRGVVDLIYPPSQLVIIFW